MTRTSKIRLLVTSGNGPVECRIAVMLTLEEMKKSARSFALKFETTGLETQDKFGPGSVIVSLAGEQIEKFSKEWAGTVQWIFKSPVRRQHKRQNWFVGIFELGDLALSVPTLCERDLHYDSFRAGGPGGQHQNTTNSAVRITHVPTGETAVSRDERSQHRNKAVARERLLEKFIVKAIAEEANRNNHNNQLHKLVERGNPVKIFRKKR